MHITPNLIYWVLVVIVCVATLAVAYTKRPKPVHYMINGMVLGSYLAASLLIPILITAMADATLTVFTHIASNYGITTFVEIFIVAMNKLTQQ